MSGASSRTIVAASVLVTIATILPGFLVGALSVQVSEEFGVTEATYGWGLGSFFIAATVVSSVMGRVAQDIGPRRQVTAALTLTSATCFVLAAFASSFLAFAGLLAVLGLSNSANQSAINLLLTQAKLPRLGLAIAIKQSGMPAAALLGGLAVPSIAVNVGWRWVYVVAGAFAIIAVAILRAAIAPVGRMARSERAAPVTPRHVLRYAAVGFACLAFAAGALNAWTVSSGVDAGLSEGVAGLLLSAGAACGIVVRLVIGTRLDTLTRSPMVIAAGLCLLGAVGLTALAVRSPVVVLLATLLAFGTGWVWPVLTNFGVITANREGAAAATGLTQTGVYIGVFSGPLLSGVLIDRFGYSTMWLCTAVVMVAGAGIVSRVRF